MAGSISPRKEIIEVMKLLYDRGLINIMGGNASIVDRTRGIVYISPSAVPKNLLKPEDIAVISLNGDVISGNPSSEYRMHLSIYRMIPRAKSVLHAHLPHAVLAGDLGLVLNPLKYVESKYTVGDCVSMVPSLPSGSKELAEATAGALARTGCRVAILLGHGAVAYSDKSLYHALDSLEGLEFLSYLEIKRFEIGNSLSLKH
ncbi:MAG: class II aldolase/adducin family protein [Desulfurococcales archaeon]|nr:class II aldolase/adducin family protein [Desulfurococcales archaeon]